MEVYWRLASTDASEREAASVELVQDLLLDHHIVKTEKQKQENKAEKEKTEKKAVAESSEKLEKRARKRKSAIVHNNLTDDDEEEAACNNGTAEMGVPNAPITHTHEDSPEDDGLYNCTPSVQYALKRLIRGVSSSRQCARQGFAMALASLLEALPWVKLEPVLKIVKRSLEVTSSMKGQEKRDGLLGQLFALGAVVRSGRLVGGDADMEEANLTRDITEQLLSLAKRKVFLREPAVTVLLYFFEKLPLGALQDSVFSSPLLQETLCMDIEKASADTLLLALKLRERLPSYVVESCPLLPNSKSTHALFEPSHLVSLVPVLKDSTSCHPRVHPVWSFLVELLFQESSDGLPIPQKRKKQQQKKNDIEVAKTIDQRVASFWNLVVDNSLLTSSHQRKYLSMELLQLLLPKLSASCAHYILSKTFVRCLLDILAAKGNLLYKSAQACLGSLCEWAKADEQRIVPVIISLQHASNGKFGMLSKTPSVKQLVSSLKSKEGCFLLYDKLVELFDGGEYLSHQAHPPVSEDAKDSINTLRSCISQLSSGAMDANNEQTQKMRAMASLLMQLLLQSATTGVNDIASELILCCKKAFGDLIKVDANGNLDDDKEGAAPSFMDVLVDILLSLLAQSSAPIRAAAEQVFKSFCGDLEESNMMSLLRVVKKQLKSGRRVVATPLDTGESDEDQLLEVEESEDDSVIIDHDDNDDDEDESNDDTAEEPKPKRLHTLDSDTGIKEGVKSGDHDHETSKDISDSEDNFDSGMDDEAMFSIDAHLANLLKQRGAASGKGEGKDAQTQLLHFKFRVLSLIEYFFQKKAGSPLCLTALPHLLQAFVFSSSAGGNPQLAERIGSILGGKLFKAKEYPKGQEVDKVAVVGLFQRCMKVASRSKIKRVRQVAQSCSLWLVKVLHVQPSHTGNESETLMKEIQDVMKDCFFQRKCCLKTGFFRDLFVRFPGIGLASLGFLVDSCRRARSEFLRQEAVGLISSILQFNTGKKSGQFRECLVQHLTALSEVLASLMEKPPSNKPRKSESRCFCLSLFKAVAQELPEKPVKKLIGKPAYNLCVSYLGASVIEGIVKVKGAASSGLDSHEEGTIKKRAKHMISE